MNKLQAYVLKNPLSLKGRLFISKNFCIDSYSRQLMEAYRHPGALGVTLVELLMALVVASLILSASGFMLTTFLTSSQKQEKSQAVRESASRLNYLVQIEASEASSVEYGAPASLPTGCLYVKGVNQPLFNFRVPQKDGTYGLTGSYLNIFYFKGAEGVWRCGPDTKQNGELEQGVVGSSGAFTPPVYLSGIVLRGANIDVIKSSSQSCGADVSDDKKLVFTTSFEGVNWKPSCTIARARTVYVCNPPSAAMLAEKLKDPAYTFPKGVCST